MVNALKGYFVAMSYCLAQPLLESMSDTQVHIVRILTDGGNTMESGDFELILQEAEAVVPPEIRAHPNVMRLIMWPFVVVRKVLPFVGNQSRFREELQRAMESTGD